MSGGLNRQPTQTCNKRSEQNFVQKNERPYHQNNTKLHFTSFTEPRKLMYSTDCQNSKCCPTFPMMTNFCAVKSQFWRRRLYQHWKMLRNTRHTQFHTKVFNILFVIICLFSKLSLCQADNSGGNILKNLNNDRNSVRPECKMGVRECELLPNGTTCFGVKLPYSYSTTQLATDSENQEEVQKNLLLWQGNKKSWLFYRITQPVNLHKLSVKEN